MNCSSNQLDIVDTACPSVLSASDHQKYISGNTQPIDIENLRYSATINNFTFVDGCSKINENFDSDLSILFLVKPNNLDENSFELPFYMAIIDSEENLIQKQYYKFEGVLRKNSEDNYVETEFIKKIKIKIENKDMKDFLDKTIILGFMLDKEKLTILN